MKVAAIIPARYASTRFPGKALVNIAGKPMVQHVYERVKAAGIEEVIIATDDERVEKRAAQFAKVMMTGAHHESGTERCAEVLEKMDDQPDIVINVQGDEPYVAAEHLEAIISCFKNERTAIASLVKKIERQEELFNPNIPKVALNQQKQALYFSRSTIPYLRNIKEDNWLQEQDYYKHIGLYAYRAEVLREIVKLPPGQLEMAERLEQLRWLENGYVIQMAETTVENVAIDTPADLERLLSLLPPEE